MEFKFIWQKARFRSWIWEGIAGCCTWKSESKILDLGCGTGTLTTQLTNFAGTVIGVDSSYDMIEKARSQFNNIEFIVGDALNLPFENEFDVVFLDAVFHWIENHDLLLKNIHRALKDNDFRIDRVYAYDRPTVLKDEKQGLANWMKQFFVSELEQRSKENQEQIQEKIEKHYPSEQREEIWTSIQLKYIENYIGK